MAHPAYLREKARTMRIERKLTIDELAERLALSRSTIYYWVRDLPIPGSGSGGGLPRSAHEQAGLAIKRKHRLLREAAYAEGAATFRELSVDPSFRDFVCLYIAEGYKRNRNRVAICNSDPAVVRLANQWMRRLASRPVRYSVQIHADQDVLDVARFWADELKIAPSAISLQRKSNSSRLSGRTWRCKWGVLTVVSSDTYLRARMQAWIDRLRADWLDSVALGA
jgi:excisionase family DNA binding protein